MGNFFDVNQMVATSYVRSEQLKGWFLSNAKLLLILLSGSMMFAGVTLLSYTGPAINFQSAAFWAAVVGVAPMAFIAGLLAVVIEGGTLFSSAMRLEVRRKIDQELKLLDKVQKSLGSEEYARRKKKVLAQSRVPTLLMLTCVSFSVTGSEIFWQRLFADQAWFYHILGGVLGVVCSALLIIFETHGELVERVIENTIRSSGLVQIALDQSAKSIIFNELFNRRRDRLATPEFSGILDKAAEQGLLGVVVDAVAMSGMTTSASQLKRMVDDDAESRQAAEYFLANGGEQPALAAPIELNKQRKNVNRQAVEKLFREVGAKRIADDLTGYADRLKMDARTLEKHLKAIMSEKQHA